MGAERAVRRLRGALGGAAGIAGVARLGRAVALGDVEPIDFVVCGLVAVIREGARVGKGGAIVEGGIEMLVHDIPVDVIVTANETIAVRRRLLRPKGISWNLLRPEKIEAVPVLRARRGAGAAGGR